MYDTTEVPQVRSTDPLASKLAAARVNCGAVRFAILTYLNSADPSDAWQISQDTGIKETTVSSQMRPLARLGLIHEYGMRPSDETGRERIVWAFGPGAGEHSPMPQVKTGPRKTQFKPFIPAEIALLNKAAQRDLDTFTQLLNISILDRMS